MSRPLEEILQLAHSRAAAQAEYNAALVVIDDGYEGKLDLDLPELRTKEKVAVANLMVQGVDQHGMRISSTMPDVDFPALRNVGTSTDRATRRRQAVLGWWDENGYDVMMHRRARWLIAYARAPIQICPRKLKPGDGRWAPDNEWTIDWRLRPPHDTFPAPGANPDDMTPEDCIFRYSQSLGWVNRRYPDSGGQVRQFLRRTGRRDSVGDDEMVELVEYVDGAEYVLAAVGSGDQPTRKEAGQAGSTKVVHVGGWGADAGGMAWGVELDRYQNRTGLCPAVVPSRITLGKTQGQFDQMVGMFEEQAHLMALEINAVRRSIFPDLYGIERQGEQLHIEPADGLLGRVGKIKGGDLKAIELSPGFQTYPTIDRLSESMRVQSLIPPDFGGQSGSNIRTGRRGQEIVASTVDFSIQEAQLLFQRSHKHEVTRAVATAKEYFGSRRKVYAVGWPGAKGVVDYTPNDIFEDGATFTVEYSHVGTDANMLGVNIAQAQGSDIISVATARRKHPLVDDPAYEDRQVMVEGLRRAMVTGLEQQMMAGQFPIPDGGRIIKQIIDGLPFEDAVAKIDEVMSQRQAPDVNPVAPGSPEAQPGMSPPGIGAEAAAIPPSTPSRDHLAQLLHQVAATRGAVNAA